MTRLESGIDGVYSGNDGLEKKETKISMKALLIAIVCVAAAVGGLAGCGAESPPSAMTTSPSGTPQPLRAPEFSLQSAHGGTVSLAALLDGREGAALVFYRGFF